MIKKTSLIKLMIVVGFAHLASGCATGQQPRSEFASDLPIAEAQYTVKSGDRLVDISRKLTGSTRNWETIASYNGIENPDLLAVGDVIAIPGSLLGDIFQNSAPTPARDSALKNVAKAGSERGSVPNTTALALQRPKRVTDEVADDVVVAPVVINRSFTLEPIDPDKIRGSAATYNTLTQKVKVLGSYYPKGIYQQPANYAKLMMRVSPGTILELEMEVNDWYKIKTDSGIGYIRKLDGALLDD